MVRFPYNPISWVHHAYSNLIRRVEWMYRGNRDISPTISFLNKATKVTKQLLKLTCIHHCKSQATLWDGRTQQIIITWSTFQRVAVTPADKLVQKWHRTRNETFPKVATIEKSIFRKILTTKCSIFHWQSTIMASIATYWVLAPRILAALDFPRIRDFRVLFSGKIAKLNTREIWLMIFRFSRN